MSDTATVVAVALMLGSLLLMVLATCVVMVITSLVVWLRSRGAEPGRSASKPYRLPGSQVSFGGGSSPVAVRGLINGDRVVPLARVRTSAAVGRNVPRPVQSVARPGHTDTGRMVDAGAA